MSASTIRLPWKSSRTSTHAMSVPNTTLTSATTRAAPTVRRMADAASGVVTAPQNRWGPSCVERQTTAPSGIRTRRLIHVVASPAPRAVPRLRLKSPPGRPVVGRPSAAALLANGDADGLLDVGHDAAGGVEELLRHLGPAAEVLDREQPLGGREWLVELHVGDRAVAVLGEDLLGLLALEVLEERGGLLRVLRRLRHRDGVLDEDRRVGDDVVDLLALLLGEDRLVLVGEEDVTLAGRERLQRLAGAVVLDGHVLEEGV